jgi:hypothetical protein
MRSLKRYTLGVTAAAAVLALAACGDDSSQPLLTEQAAPTAQIAAGPAMEQLARLVAVSMRDASVRAQFHAATAASPVREGKLHLSSYLRGQGSALLKAMSRASGTPESEVLALIGGTGPLEIYLPVDAHRAAWKGGDNVIIAAQLIEEEAPFAVDLQGRPVALSLETAPTTPVISIVPAEGFDEQGNAWGATRHGAANLSLSASPTGPSFGMNPDGSWTGLWVNEVHTSQEYEPWTKGDPEFEMHLDNATTRERRVCAEEDNSIEPYRFNMDGTNYYSPFLIADDTEMPQGAPFAIYLYEDDDTRCVVKDDKDYPKLIADVLTNSASVYKALKSKEWENGQWVVKAYNAYVAFKSILTGEDEFAGATAGLSDIGSTPQTFQLKDQNQNNIGWVSLQWKSDFPH